MELPHLGSRCTDADCNQLDFLPIKCDACEKIFCVDHFKYENHRCAVAQRRNNVVPTCSLCDNLVPSKGLPEAEAMKIHLENNCSRYRKTRLFSNRCNEKQCKRKELIRITCEDCEMSFCIKHRHPRDHDCGGKAVARELRVKAIESRSRETKEEENSGATAGTLATNCAEEHRLVNQGRDSNRVTTDTVASTNANLSEEEALALAIAMSTLEAKKREEQSQKRLVHAPA